MFTVKKNYAGHEVTVPESVNPQELLTHLQKYYKTSKILDKNRISVPTKNQEKLQRRLNRFKSKPQESDVPSTTDLSTLTAYSEDFLKKNYGLDLPVPILINNRLRRSLGRCSIKRSMGQFIPHGIDLAGRLLQYYEIHEVYDVLRHELIHLAGVMLNKPYRDGESWFESELRKHNSASTKTIKRKGEIHVYGCDSCSTEHKRTTKIDVTKYRCHCGGHLYYKGSKVVQ